jgi:hypothetical protein
MDCEKVRDQFSSLWEKALIPSEEKEVREHFSSCPECQKEWGQFEKTMRWLHSVGEVEIPEGFLPELHKKMEERKSKTILAEKAGGKWLNLPFSLKLPVQAVAMVAIIFLVLYLTKMMPNEGDRLKDSESIPSPPLAEKRSEQVFAQKEMEKERGATEIPLKAPRPEDAEEAKPLKVEAASSKPEVMANQTIDSKAAAGLRVSSSEPKEIEKGLSGKDKFVQGSKPLREIVLRISDQEKAISLLHELIREFGGEIVTSEGNAVLASLPSVSFSKFENELVGLSASIKADKITTKEPGPKSLRMATERKREEADEKSQGSSRAAIDQENRTVVRILLIQE